MVLIHSIDSLGTQHRLHTSDRAGFCKPGNLRGTQLTATRAETDAAMATAFGLQSCQVVQGVWSGHADGYHRGDGCLVPCLAKYSSLRGGCTLWQDAAKHAASPAAMAVAITKPNGCHKIGYGHQTHNSRDSKTHHIYIYIKIN